MQISSILSAINPDKLSLKQLAASTVLTKQQKVAELSKDFEAILVGQFLQEAQKPLFKSELFADPASDGIYGGMLNHQLAEAIARGGGFGLARSLEKPLERQLAGPTSKSGESAPAKPLKPLFAPVTLKPLHHPPSLHPLDDKPTL